MKASIVCSFVLTFACYHAGGAVSEISHDHVHYWLFNSNNPTGMEELLYNDVETLHNSSFNKEWPVRFSIHGYLNDKDSEVNYLIRSAYLEKGDFNIIVMDWSLFTFSAYTLARDMVQSVGPLLGQFSMFLHAQGVDYNDMYVIGHSLGAHVAGVAGHYISPNKYNTIFALDPARPGFEIAPKDQRIDASDAKYVESIHTDTSWIGFGLVDPVGNASFYPNFDKSVQPGCDYISCSHLRSYMYFAESINSKVGFYGSQTDNLSWLRNQMGGEPSTPKQGVYYLITNAVSPFARGRDW